MDEDVKTNDERLANSLKILKKCFDVEDPREIHTKFYEFGGWRQSKRKTEFVNLAQNIAKERGFPGYQGDRDDMGVPLGQRKLEPLYINGTDVICEGDDLHQINNAAMQQMLDDIKRTGINTLDMPHMILNFRVGITVTPETINRYLEMINHTTMGGAVAQEHMAEINPGLVGDSYVKLIVGDSDVADQIDRRFIVDIENNFFDWQTEKLRQGIGKHLYQVVRVPTIAVRIADGGIVHRWANTATTLAFVAAYNLGGGNSVLSDFALAAKHVQYIFIGTSTWPRRIRSPNEPGGIPFGYISDICQADSVVDPHDEPAHHVMETGTLGTILQELIWFGGYMAGGIGPPIATSAAYTNGIIDDFSDYGRDYIMENFGGYAVAKPTLDLIKSVTHDVSFQIMEAYDEYPILMEHHWGGLVRLAVQSALASAAVGLATGHSLATLMASTYAFCHAMKEAWGRTGFGGMEATEHVMLANAASLAPEEGLLPELRGPNMATYSFPGHVDSAITGCAAAHAARGDAWALSPVVKAAFSDRDMVFDFRKVRAEIARGAIREFMPAGDRELIKPALG